jgi:hypothetical protein
LLSRARKQAVPHANFCKLIQAFGQAIASRRELAIRVRLSDPLD